MEWLSNNIFWFVPREWGSLVHTNLVIACLMVSLAALIFIFILGHRFRNFYRARRADILRKKAANFITGVMFDNYLNDSQQINSFERKYLGSAFEKKIFIAELIHIYKNISGETAENLRLAYIELKLDDYSERKISNLDWKVKATGIYELTAMNARHKIKPILGYINSSNEILRAEAHIAVVKLTPEIPSQFFEILEVSITDWEQLRLADALDNIGYEKIPQFEMWLTKEDVSLKVFFIRMIAHFGQRVSEDRLAQLLDAPVPEIRREVIVAFRKMVSHNKADRLVEIYDREDLELRREIMQTLAVIGNINMLGFFQDKLDDPDYYIRLQAARAIEGLGERGNYILELFNHDEDHPVREIVAHVLDKRIQ